MKKLLQFTLLFISSAVFAQTNITAVGLTYSASAGFTYNANGASGAPNPIPGTSYTYNFGSATGTSNNLLTLNSFVAGGFNYNPVVGVIQNVFLRRNGTSPNNSIIYYDGSIIGTQINLDRSYEDDMEIVYNGYTNFNAGTDNLFTNQGDGNGNNNNIEKVDVIFSAGVSLADASKRGIALFERGLTNQHDKFTIAVITSLTVANNAAASYAANVLSIGAGSYGTTDLITVGNQKYQILRKQIGSPNNLQYSASAEQNMGGVFIKFSDFGIANGTTIYGYSILPSDANLNNGTDVLNYGGSIGYKTNTTNADGGLDLVAITGVAEESGTAALNTINLNAVKERNGANLNWMMDDVDFGINFEIEKSEDGIIFNKIADKQSDFNRYYNYLDISQITSAKVFYRIKAISSEGKLVISNRIYLKNYSTTKINVLTSNPLLGNEISLSIKSDINETAMIMLLDTDGKLLLSKKMELTKGINFTQINFPINFNAKSFYLQIKSADISFSELIIKQ